MHRHSGNAHAQIVILGTRISFELSEVLVIRIPLIVLVIRIHLTIVEMAFIVLVISTLEVPVMLSCALKGLPFARFFCRDY